MHKKYIWAAIAAGLAGYYYCKQNATSTTYSAGTVAAVAGVAGYAYGGVETGLIAAGAAYAGCQAALQVTPATTSAV